MTSKNQENMPRRSGFVSIIGLTNVGKSTLMNTLVGSKISIVSHKVQTTRQRIMGMLVHKQTQITFVDTPGYFQPKKRLDRAMISAALSAPKDGDITFVLVDPMPVHFDTHLEMIKKTPFPKNHPVVLVINKIDLVKKNDLLTKIEAFTQAYEFDQVFLISALKGEGTEALLDYAADQLPEGPWLYPEEQMTDMPARLLAAELTRENVYKYLHQELPYEIHVETEGWEQFDNGDLKINQIIHVSRDSQKGIVLGKGGAKLKEIGAASRKSISDVMGRTVHIKLHVRVTKNWADKRENFEIMGLDFNV